MDVEKLTDAELNARFTRAYEIAHNRKVVDVYAPSFAQRWRDAPFTAKLAAVVIAGFALPWCIIIGGLAILAIFDYFSR